MTVKKIGILTAMDLEMAPLLTFLKEEGIELSECILGPRTFIAGTLYGVQLIIAVAGIGKVASTLTATLMLQHFKLDQLIFTGVAGGVSDAVSIGDIVLGASCYQHDMDCSPHYAPYVIPALNMSHFPSNPELLEIFKSLAKKLEFQAHVGVIASGDQFVHQVAQAQNILSNARGDTSNALKEVIAIEMEGAAVAQVCYEYQVPHLVVRVISDKADSEATEDYLTFMNEVGCWVARDLIKAYLKLRYEEMSA